MIERTERVRERITQLTTSRPPGRAMINSVATKFIPRSLYRGGQMCHNWENWHQARRQRDKDGSRVGTNDPNLGG